ncbi:MAG: hypothetical protein O8C64_11045 [Candidatus Methanoperedens sp.]|nr:hypothetical protein [Candidatus Methanoperedens sp.]
MSYDKIYIRIVGFILCLPFLYMMFACSTQPLSLIIPCAVGAGTGFAIEVDAALVIGLFLLITGGGKLKN